jgi:hypothetical protein
MELDLASSPVFQHQGSVSEKGAQKWYVDFDDRMDWPGLRPSPSLGCLLAKVRFRAARFGLLKYSFRGMKVKFPRDGFSLLSVRRLLKWPLPRLWVFSRQGKFASVPIGSHLFASFTGTIKLCDNLYK